MTQYILSGLPRPSYVDRHVFTRTARYLVLSTCIVNLMSDLFISQYRSGVSSWGSLVAVWGMVAMTCIPIAMYTGVQMHWDNGEERSFCQQPNGQGAIQKTFALGLLLIYYVCPIVMTIVPLLVTKSGSTPDGETEACLDEGRNGPEGISKVTVCACLAVFILCRLPTHMTQINDAFGVTGPSLAAYWLGVLAQALFFLQCALNPMATLLCSRYRSCTQYNK